MNKLQDGVGVCSHCGWPVITEKESCEGTQAEGFYRWEMWRIVCQNVECPYTETKGYPTERGIIDAVAKTRSETVQRDIITAYEWDENLTDLRRILRNLEIETRGSDRERERGIVTIENMIEQLNGCKVGENG